MILGISLARCADYGVSEFVKISTFSENLCRRQRFFFFILSFFMALQKKMK